MVMFRETRTGRGRRSFVAASLALVVSVVSVLVDIGSIASVRAADPSSDIPGIPLPGPVTAGRLGGDVYDVVYQLSVAPGHVIVASLTGAAGTDFDIYLFSASATTVLSPVGQLTKSTGPTSSEAISWPSSLGGIYYIDLNGATNVEGDYRLTVQTVPDSTPPVVSMVLAGGRGVTSQLTIPVTLVATDDLSGVSEMAFSEDGATYSPWAPFAASATWTFGPGGGSKTLWAKVRNGVGLESMPTLATVAIDTTAPNVTALQPAKGSSVVGLRPPFTVGFDEPIDPVSWTDLGLIVQSSSGALIVGTYAYDAAKRVGSFIPSSTLVAGATYVITLGDVRDVAGNPVTPLGSWTVVPLAPVDLEGRAVSSAIAPGQSTRIDLTLSGAPEPAAVEILSSSSASGGFVPLTTMDIVNGRLSLTVTPALNTIYRFRYGGAFGVGPAQLDVPVLVRRSVVLVGRNSAVVSKARVGATVKLTGAIGPAAGGVTISFRRYRFDTGRRAWVYAGSNGRRTDASGHAVLVWTPPSAGSWYVRAVVSSTTEFANNTSAVYRWSISR